MLNEIYPIDCGCEHPHMPPPPAPNGYVNWCPPPPVPPMPYPVPPVPPCNCDSDCNCKKPETSEGGTTVPTTPTKKSLSEQLCQLSRRSAAITNMIDLFKNKNKDAIVKIGTAVSYNFGTYYSSTEDNTISTYGELIMTMLETELNLIKEKIAELAKLLGEEDLEGENLSILTTVTRD